jgi:hypothetical protein
MINVQYASKKNNTNNPKLRVVTMKHKYFAFLHPSSFIKWACILICKIKHCYLQRKQSYLQISFRKYCIFLKSYDI